MRSKVENVHHYIFNFKVKIFLLQVILVDSATNRVASSRLNYYQDAVSRCNYYQGKVSRLSYYQDGFKTEHINIIRVNYSNKIGKNSQ